jgi:hypothetical protein
VHYPAGFVVIKTHAAGTEWFESLGLPETLTIGCTSLLDEGYDQRRPYLRGDLALGRHYVYRYDGFVPRFEYDCYFDIGLPWTRTPPSPTKYWVRQMEPARLPSLDFVLDSLNKENKTWLL